MGLFTNDEQGRVRAREHVWAAGDVQGGWGRVRVEEVTPSGWGTVPLGTGCCVAGARQGLQGFWKHILEERGSLRARCTGRQG